MMAATPEPRGSDRLLGELLELADEGLVLLDASGFITTANDAASRLLANGGGLLGQRLESIMPPEFVEHVNAALASRRRRNSFAASHAGRDLMCTVKRLKNGAALSVRDDTALVEERERADAILAAAADGLVLIASDGRVDCANPAAYRMLARTERSLLGKLVSLDSLVGEKSASSLASAAGEPVEVHLPRHVGGDAGENVDDAARGGSRHRLGDEGRDRGHQHDVVELLG